MGKLILDVSMSLDGFAAGAGVGVDQPMGEGGEGLHDWMYGKAAKPADREIGEAMFDSAGAVLIGRRTFNVGEEPWGDDGTFHLPCFVVTHHAREKLAKGPTTFTFVTDGIKSALDQAMAAADGKDVILMGPTVAQQYFQAGLVDEMRIHLVPMLLNAGTRLFDQISDVPVAFQAPQVIESPSVTHLKFHTS